MKSQRYLFLLMAFAICLQSCKKSSTSKDTGTPTTKPKYLTQAIAVVTSPGVSTYNKITTYTYDDKKRLSSIKASDQSSSGTVATVTYSYNGDQLYTIDVISNGTHSSNNLFSYNNDGTVKSVILTSYRDGAVFTTVEYDYVYKNGQVTERHSDTYYEIYTYDSNHNLIKSDGHGPYNILINYVYDNKKSMFTGVPTNVELGGADVDPAGDRYATNNQVQSSITVDSGSPITSSISYVYDSDGYPTGGTTGDATNGSKLSFTYSTLE